MTTSAEHAEYLKSEHWQNRRREYLVEQSRCVACFVPRWLAKLVYDQDLHVHHVSYANIGHELDYDLQPLCRRCHDLETYGTTGLQVIPSVECNHCGSVHFDIYKRDMCEFCEYESDRNEALGHCQNE